MSNCVVIRKLLTLMFSVNFESRVQDIICFSCKQQYSDFNRILTINKYYASRLSRPVARGVQ